MSGEFYSSASNSKVFNLEKLIKSSVFCEQANLCEFGEHFGGGHAESRQNFPRIRICMPSHRLSVFKSKLLHENLLQLSSLLY